MAKSKISKAFTTVTPFSKLLAAIMFITFPFIGFMLGMHYQKMITPAFPPTVYEPVQKPPVDAMRPPVNEIKPLVSGEPFKGQTLCTQDAKMCPDGSYVGRTGPQCEFVCPPAKVKAM